MRPSIFAPTHSVPSVLDPPPEDWSAPFARLAAESRLELSASDGFQVLSEFYSALWAQPNERASNQRYTICIHDGAPSSKDLWCANPRGLCRVLLFAFLGGKVCTHRRHQAVHGGTTAPFDTQAKAQ